MPLAGEGRVEKRFRVAREGQTVDGRELSRDEIKQMAETYNPEHYAGRINIEHFSGWSPEPPFNAYGDIIKVEAVEENGKYCLYNSISALPNFVAMNKNGQKIYPSIEFYRNFAGTGKAYQVGLGMTDSPASLGTQAIKFSANHFSVQTQPDMEIYMTMSAPEQNTPATSTGSDQKGFLEQLKTLLTPSAKPQESDEEFKTTVAQGLVTALNAITDIGKTVNQLSLQVQALTPTTVPTTAPAQPVQQATVAVSTADTALNPAEQLAQALQPLALQMQNLQQQFSQLSTTAINPPPAISGGSAEKAEY